MAGYQNNDSWQDRYNSEKTFFSGIVDADLAQPLPFQPAMNIQKMDVNSPTWGGLPRWNTDGQQK
nr:ferric-rhodotorulic acid outer membrane transporter [Salmonella sp. NCTC 7297]